MDFCFRLWDLPCSKKRTESTESSGSTKSSQSNFEQGMVGLEKALYENAPPDQPNWIQNLNQYSSGDMVAASDEMRRSCISYDHTFNEVARTSCVFLIRGIPYVIPGWV